MDTTKLSKEISTAKLKAQKFVESTFDGSVNFRFTLDSDASAFSRCFGIYCFNFLGLNSELEPRATQLGNAICEDLQSYKIFRQQHCRDLLLDKHYLQLLTFSLSALSIVAPSMLNDLDESRFIGSIENLEAATKAAVKHPGAPQHGNINMAHGVLLIWLIESGRVKSRSLLDSWVQKHLNTMNQFGYWGSPYKPTYIQFQNGYHQYEIFDYLAIDVAKEIEAAEMVAKMVDPFGGFSPYSGGGGCYDYDAVHMLTRLPPTCLGVHKSLLFKVAKYLMIRQNSDGGFCESHDIRPRSVKNFKKSFAHICSSSPDRYSRIRHFITMLRPTHNKYKTHFSSYQRDWNESNLWDTWFRLMALDRIESALIENRISKAGYINFPGIGFDKSAKNSD